MGHDDFVNNCLPKDEIKEKICDQNFYFVISQYFYLLCILAICNFTPRSFFINSPQILHGTGFECLLKAFFTIISVSFEIDNPAMACSL
ncbi:hypothetical protein BpHYR1_047424 [Brachionus plicatilis]|uniref:Uncharacterized protein n=1 Tax=Brachionus plicatilis TaxID=10195 RepID=A0A3M7T1X4_BRAPC|nr:hypothetical protein BpHYR1_047424 [Brachionus plicatilis]